jgi:hypothetical protein
MTLMTESTAVSPGSMVITVVGGIREWFMIDSSETATCIPFTCAAALIAWSFKSNAITGNSDFVARLMAMGSPIFPRPRKATLSKEVVVEENPRSSPKTLLRIIIVRLAKEIFLGRVR